MFLGTHFWDPNVFSTTLMFAVLQYVIYTFVQLTLRVIPQQ